MKIKAYLIVFLAVYFDRLSWRMFQFSEWLRDDLNERLFLYSLPSRREICIAEPETGESE